mgnify:FL=1
MENKKSSQLYNYIKDLSDNINQDNIKNYYQWFSKNSKIYDIINKTESVKVQKRNRTKIKRCFDNCYKAIYQEKDLKYIIGYTFAIIPIEHAFLVNENNEVIDPTLSINTDSHSDRYGSEYMGIEIPRNILTRILAHNQNSFVPISYLYWEYLNKKKSKKPQKMGITDLRYMIE